MPDMLFHMSDQPDIARFEPRPAPNSTQTGAMVWAIDREHLHNYLLPRDCPRITFYALPDSQPEHVTRLMGYSSAAHIVAIEAGWLAEVRQQTLYCYELSGASFALIDEGAGYYISREAVIPRTVTVIEDLLGELLRHDVELRVMPSLWPLYDAVVASTLQFSIIRMRNAQPRAST